MNRVLMIICLAFLLLHTGMPYAQETPKQAEQAAAPAPAQPVVLGNRTIFTLNGIEKYSARERAITASRRVQAIAENPSLDTVNIGVSSYPQPMTMISVGNELIMTVFEEDALAAGLSQKELAARWSRELRAAIDGYRQEHTLKWILKGAVKASVATLVLLVLVFLLIKLIRKADDLLQEWIGRNKISIHIQSLELVRSEKVVAFFSGILRTIRIILFLFLLYGYSQVVLLSFPWTSAYADQISQFVVRPFQVISEALWVQIPNLFFIIVICVLAFYFTKLLHLVFTELERGVIKLEGFYPEWALPTYKICRLLTIGVALIMAFPYIPGSHSPAFKGISIFLGVLLSLGSTSAISNILAGYSLIYRRAFKVGDRVKIGDFMGDVMEMRLEVTHLRTIKNEEIVVPNSLINNSHVINFSSLSRQRGLILHAAVTIGYDVPWRQVHALLLLAAQRTHGLLRKPAPFVFQTSLDDFYVSYELNAYSDKPLEMVELYSELYQNIQDAFNEYGVQIMSPWYRFDPEHRKVVSKDQWYAAPAQPPETDRSKDQGYGS